MEIGRPISMAGHMPRANSFYVTQVLDAREISGIHVLVVQLDCNGILPCIQQLLYHF